MRLPADKAAWINEQLRDVEARISRECGIKVSVTVDAAGDASVLVIDDIVGRVCKALHVRVILLLSKSRKEDLLMARYVCLHMVRLHLGEKPPALLAELFNRDRTTILHAYQEIEKLIETNNPTFKAALETVLKAFKANENEQELPA